MFNLCDSLQPSSFGDKPFWRTHGKGSTFYLVIAALVMLALSYQGLADARYGYDTFHYDLSVHQITEQRASYLRYCTADSNMRLAAFATSINDRKYSYDAPQLRSLGVQIRLEVLVDDYDPAPSNIKRTSALLPQIKMSLYRAYFVPGGMDPSGKGLIEAFDCVARLGPFICNSANDLGQEAIAEAQNSGLPGGSDGLQDAFRHCVWSCKMARSWFGENDAKVVADIHEDNSTNTPAQVCMDQWNNRQGRGAADMPNSCSENCMALLDSGNYLQESPGCPGGPGPGSDDDGDGDGGGYRCGY